MEPYKLMFYCDEAAPGDIKRFDNKRKTLYMYFATEDVGIRLLKHDAMWLPLASIITEMIKTIDGGWSACFFRR